MNSALSPWRDRRRVPAPRPPKQFLLVVHLLRQGDQDLARLFGAQTGDEVDKFEDVEWRSGPDGCPVLARCDWFAGTITERINTGDHVAFVLAPHEGVSERSGTRQLGMQEIGDIEAGH